MKIEGTVFGESAKLVQDKLTVNGLYRISRGQIR